MSSVDLSTPDAERIGRALGDAGREIVDLTDVNRAEGEATLIAATIPRRTGLLEETTHVVADARGFTLTATAPYAGYVHAVNPFLTRALDARVDDIVDALVDHTETVLNNIT